MNFDAEILWKEGISYNNPSRFEKKNCKFHVLVYESYVVVLFCPSVEHLRAKKSEHQLKWNEVQTFVEESNDCFETSGIMSISG